MDPSYYVKARALSLKTLLDKEESKVYFFASQTCILNLVKKFFFTIFIADFMNIFTIFLADFSNLIDCFLLRTLRRLLNFLLSIKMLVKI